MNTLTHKNQWPLSLKSPQKEMITCQRWARAHSRIYLEDKSVTKEKARALSPGNSP